MKYAFRIRLVCLVLLLAVVFSCAGCGEGKEQRDSREIIEEMVVDYGSYGQEAEGHIRHLNLSAVVLVLVVNGDFHLWSFPPGTERAGR